MTRRNALPWLAVFVLAALPLAAGDLAGKWAGTVTGPHGVEDVRLLLKTAGSQVTGSVGPDEDRQFPIENARLDGDKFTFQVKGPNGAAFNVELALNGDSLKGSGTRTLNRETETSTFDLKRVP
jgi:hypothetical protein